MLESVVVCDDVETDLDALITDEYVGSSNELPHLIPVLRAERTPKDLTGSTANRFARGIDQLKVIIRKEQVYLRDLRVRYGKPHLLRSVTATGMLPPASRTRWRN